MTAQPLILTPTGHPAASIFGCLKNNVFPPEPHVDAGMSPCAVVVESEDYFHWRQTADGNGLVSLLMGLVIRTIRVLAPPSFSVHP